MERSFDGGVTLVTKRIIDYMLPKTEFVLNAKFPETVVYHLESSKEIQIVDLNFTTELWATVKGKGKTFYYSKEKDNRFKATPF